MVNHKSNPRNFFSKEEKEKIVQAIQAAEKRTSGEIRVHLERKTKGPIMERAEKVFAKLGMTKTRERNGVLIYFSLADHAFAIYGDKGIHERASQSFWSNSVAIMQERFAGGDFLGGLIEGIEKVGQELAKDFPRKTEDINELPDEIS